MARVSYKDTLCTAEELAEIFGDEVKHSMASGKSPEFIAEQARFAFRLAALALEKRDRLAGRDAFEALWPMALRQTGRAH